MSAALKQDGGEVVAIGSANKPEPLTPSGSYVGGEFMPIYHRDLRGSHVWRKAPPAAKVYCLDFWMLLWEQTPACSCPKDEDWIRRQLGISDKRVWDSMKPWILRDMEECRDGLLYHRKQSGYANAILKRRAQKNGKAKDAEGKPKPAKKGLEVELILPSGMTPKRARELLAELERGMAKTGGTRVDPVSTQCGPSVDTGSAPGPHMATPNENSDLVGQSARRGASDKMDRIEERKNPPSEGAAVPAQVEAGPPAVLTEEDRAKAMRKSLGMEWVGIMERIAPTLEPKKREILKNSLMTHYGKGLDGGLQALQALRDVERATLCGRLLGYEACTTDEQRTKVVHDYLWAIVKKKPQPQSGRPVSAQQAKLDRFKEEAKRRMGAVPEQQDDNFQGTVIDGETV